MSDRMMAATVSGKFEVKGTRVGNLFVHYNLGIGYDSPNFPTQQMRNHYIIAHFKSGYRIDHVLRDMPKLKVDVIALAKKINAAVPEFENDEVWMLAHVKKVGRKLKAFLQSENIAITKTVKL